MGGGPRGGAIGNLARRGSQEVSRAPEDASAIEGVKAELRVSDVAT